METEQTAPDICVAPLTTSQEVELHQAADRQSQAPHSPAAAFRSGRTPLRQSAANWTE